MIAKEAQTQNQTIRNYYQFQSLIYDATRWSFLFGRKRILDLLSFHQAPQHIVEIGCGTGANLEQLVKRYPDTSITGIDVSTAMLEKAHQKLERYSQINLQELAYGNQPSDFQTPPDVILFSYTLTMINPQYQTVLQQAFEDLPVGGKIGVVDFHRTSLPWFKKHMENHHVRMEAHLTPLLQDYFSSMHLEVRKAYLGWWEYFLFVGEKR